MHLCEEITLIVGYQAMKSEIGQISFLLKNHFTEVWGRSSVRSRNSYKVRVARNGENKDRRRK